MKNFVFLYAGENASHAFDAVFSGRSAFDRCLDWAASVPGLCGISVGCTSKNRVQVEQAAARLSADVRIAENDAWDTAQLLSALSREAAAFHADNAVYSPADRPFLDLELTKELIESHFKYVSEYTFADGYPAGFAPEVMHCGTVQILSSLANETHRELGCLPVSNESIFTVMKTDINSFEIESVIAPKDYRMLRLDFSCAIKRNLVACERLYSLAEKNGIPFTAEKLSDFAQSCAPVQQTLPAFYNVQISQNCAAVPFYSPYKDAFLEKYGVLPFKEQNNAAQDMDFSRFVSLLNQIESFSEDAVVGLSAWGEPLLNGRFAEFVQAVLSHDQLSVLVETDGTLVTEELARQLSGLARNASPRKNGLPPLMWIVSIDAASRQMYDTVFENGDFESAVRAVSVLHKHFPSAVYPQFTRVNENESELESFYRFWHSKDSPSGGNVIIQKYNDFCRKLPDRKPADLSPLERNPCWHLKRDMTVLCDGSVPLCRQRLFSSVGNVFDEGVEKVWKKISEASEQNIMGAYGEPCRNCDEYYTFNF